MEKNILKGPELDHFPDKTLGQYYFDAAKKFGDRICQIDAITDRRETFNSVNRRSVRVALEMQKRGISSKDIIIQCSSSNLNAAIPIIATLYLGAKIGNVDVTLSVRQVTHLLSLVSPKMIFVEECAVDLIETSLANADFEAEIVVMGNSTKYSTFSEFDKPQDNEEDFRPIAVDLDETAMIYFSSGTTGLPKAICHSNSSFLHVVLNFFNSSAKLEVMLSFTSFYWVTAMFFLSSSFIGGGHRIICGNNFTAEITFQAIEKYKITYLFVAPLFTFILTNFKNYQQYDVSSVSSIVTSGTQMSSGQYIKMKKIFRDSNIVGCYGQTEVGVISMFNPTTDYELIIPKSRSSGKVSTGITLKVVDIETNEILGPNQQGEFYLKSRSVMQGYYNVDTSNCFDKDGFLKTGDLGYFDEDGCIYIVERLNEMFKYMCWQIVPAAIEAVLIEHPAIKEAVVFGLPLSEEEGDLPAACVVLNNGCSISGEEIEAFVAGEVSDKEKLRGGVFFEVELPRTPSGKIMRKDIRNKIIKSLNKY